MPASNEGLHEFTEFRLRQCVPLLEQVRIGMTAEKFNDVPQLFVSRLVSNGENFLEMLVRCPNLVAPEVDALMEPVRTCHALEVNSIQLASSPQREIVTNLIDFFQRHDFVFMPR